jgi:alpha-tubulin suppressor-like RCC1 family protein
LIPERLVSLKQYHIQQICAGCKHTVALTLGGGIVYTWGSNSHGQLGHGDRETRLEPELLEPLRHTVVLSIEAGDYHTAALVR